MQSEDRTFVGGGGEGQREGWEVPGGGGGVPRSGCAV